MLILPPDPTEKHSLGTQFPKPSFYNRHCQRVFWTELLLEEKWCFFLEGVPEGVWFWMGPHKHLKQFPGLKGILHNYPKAAVGVIGQNPKNRPAGMECLEAFHEKKVKRLFCRDWRFVEIAAYLQESQGQQWHPAQHTSPSHRGDPAFPQTLSRWL